MVEMSDDAKPGCDMQSLIVPQHPREAATNQGLLYKQTNDLLKHVDCPHSNKQENSVSSLDLPE
uniref:Phospholipase SGR2-like isoform X1 n=1 Tax=Rhizophora mucronata TaxID=61149 RepID=A0A2P2MMV4_RHIMU